MTSQVGSELPPIAAAIIVRDGRVLLIRRRVEEASLSWQFPAGAVESGESGSVAAAREAYEEVGLTVRPIETLGSRVHPATGRTMIYVVGEVVCGSARVAAVREVAEIAWCDRRQVAEFVPYPFFAPVQDYLDAHLS